MPFKIDPRESGWIPHKERSYGMKKDVEQIMQDLPLFTSEGRAIKGSWNGETVRLDDIMRKVIGHLPSDDQGIGDCVSFGGAKAWMESQCCDIYVRGEKEKFEHEVATEWYYGTSRVVHGRGRLGNSDGSVGAWMAKAMAPTGQGTLFRKKYEVGRKTYDLSRYNPRTAKDWGYKGLPLEELEEIADQYPSSAMPVPVTNFDDAADLIFNGYGIFVCSNQGFDDRRDSQGFLTARGTWYHCMAFTGVRGDRPGLLLDNESWPAWCRGPAPDGIGTGSGWVDKRIVNKMLAQRDSYAVPGVEGIEKRSEHFVFTPFG